MKLVKPLHPHVLKHPATAVHVGLRVVAGNVGQAQKTAQQFAENSHSKLNKIISADQGQFSIENRDDNTPYIKKVRVVTTITYALKD